MANEDLMAKIMADYPSFAFLLNDPDVGPLLLEAVNPEHPLDAATFQAKLLQTNWWKTTSAAQRQWVTLYNTDRATADAQLSARHAEIRDFAASLGLEVPDQKLWDATEISLHNGLATNSAQIRDMLAWFSPRGAPSAVPALSAIAAHEYMIPMSQGDLGWWSREIAAGHQTEQTFRGVLNQQARSKFAGIANLIDQGITPGAFFAPYRSQIAQELELPSADSVDLVNDPRWTQVTGISDGKGGMRPMNLSETIGLARSQSEWRFTQGANSQAADLASRVLTDFGATK